MNDPEPGLPHLPSPAERHSDRPLVLAVLTLCIGLPLLRPVAVAVDASARPVRRLVEESAAEQVRMGLVEALLTAGVFALGATIGSFLNVVVHRLPLGRSPLHGRSHCPACGHGIRARDNVPVLGWLWLGGRCRDCGSEISPRYPIVEAICGGLALLLWECELLSGGATLPVRPPNLFAGLAWVILYPRLDLIGLFLFHVGVMMVLVVWTLVATDGGRLPPRHLATMLGLVVAVTTAWPWLHPVPLVPGDMPGPPWLSRGLAVALVGLAVGGVVGSAAGRSIGPSWWPAACLALWGAACGWHAVVGTALVMAGLVAADRLAVRSTPWLPIPAPWLFLASATIHLVAWRWIHGLLFGAAQASDVALTWC